MQKLLLDSAPCLPIAAAFWLACGVAFAQPGNNSPNQFGDRQAGQWGDPGQGHFGNPAVGDFDKSKMVEPPPGTKPLGKVYAGKQPAASPYITLPQPSDAAAPVAEKPKAPAPKKKPASKRAVKKADP